MHHYSLLALARLPSLLSIDTAQLARQPFFVVIRRFKEDVGPCLAALELENAVELGDVLRQLAFCLEACSPALWLSLQVALAVESSAAPSAQTR